MKPWLLGIILATLTGALVRFADLGGHSFWYDEAYSARIAEEATTYELWTGARRDNGNPPGYYIAHRWFMMLFGKSEAGQRVLAALCGVLTIPLIGLLTRRILSGPLSDSTLRKPDAPARDDESATLAGASGLLAAWLFALSPLSVELSNEARTYSLVHLAVTLNAILFVRWLDSQKWHDGLAYLVVTAAACFLHYFVVFFIISQMLAVLATRRWSTMWRWCAIMLGVAAIWSLWAPAFLAQVSTPGNLSRMGDAWKMQFAATPIVFSVGRTFAWRDAAPWLLGSAALISFVGFCLPALVGWWRVIRVRFAEGVFLAGWIVLPVLLPLIVAILASPIYHHRYGSVGLPAFVCLVAIGLTQLSRPVRLLCGFAIVVGTAVSLTNYFTQPLKDDWRSASEVILSNVSADDCVLTDQDSEVLPLLYYAKRHGTVPARLYGLSTTGETLDRLRAVRFEGSRKLDPDFRDYTDDILTSPRITVALCVPEQPAEVHLAFFEGHGYRLVDSAEFYRVTVLRFER